MTLEQLQEENDTLRFKVQGLENQVKELEQTAKEQGIREGNLINERDRAREALQKCRNITSKITSISMGYCHEIHNQDK